MGVLNLTPDSFSDGGRYTDLELAVARGIDMAAEGADILDLGGESTRPGAGVVSEGEERRRVIPVLRRLRAAVKIPISIDTRRASVAKAALDAGADIVNDVSALSDPGMVEAVRTSGAGLVLMHMRGSPPTMQVDPVYDDVVAEVAGYLTGRVEFAVGEGVPPDAIAVDPGIGFGKTVDHNVALLRAIPRLAASGHPVVVGVSRKSLIGALTGRDVGDRRAGSVAMAAVLAGWGASVVRAHDVRDTCDAVRVGDRMSSRCFA